MLPVLFISLKPSVGYLTLLRSRGGESRSIFNLHAVVTKGLLLVLSINVHKNHIAAFVLSFLKYFNELAPFSLFLNLMTSFSLQLTTMIHQQKQFGIPAIKNHKGLQVY